MSKLRALIVLVYFDRPKIVRNALNSLKTLEYDNWELAFIDDGSVMVGKPIVLDVLENYCNRISFYNTHDTVAEKILQHGSRHGEFMNLAIRNSESDFVIILCDDDALTSWSLFALSSFFNEHPTAMYCYSHIIPFDPFIQQPGSNLPRPNHWLNRHSSPIIPSCQIDSSQVAFRTECFRQGIAFKSPMTGALDADLLSQLYESYGLCPFTGFVTQYKADFSDQMSKRPVERVFQPKDID